MDVLRSLLDRAERLYHDVRLDTVRDWKAWHGGRRAVGWMPVWAPRELVHACGMLPVGLLGGGDDVEIIRGDAYFQSYICHIPRSTIEMSLDGSLDVLDGMIFPSTCDVIRNLSGMWQLMFPDRPAWYLDTPQRFDEVGRAFFLRELESLREELGRLSGTPADNASLARSIRLYDENRRAVAALYERRRQAPWTVPTSELYLVLRAGCLLEPDEHTALVGDYLAAVEAADRPPLDNARVVLVGSFCEPGKPRFGFQGLVCTPKPLAAAGWVSCQYSSRNPAARTSRDLLKRNLSQSIGS